jgi:hypothetical protein
MFVINGVTTAAITPIRIIAITVKFASPDASFTFSPPIPYLV